MDTEAEDFFSFLTEVCHGPDGGLQIMYGIGGETQLDERTLEHLDGYEHSLPVRVGNGAYDQASTTCGGLWSTRSISTRSPPTSSPNHSGRLRWRAVTLGSETELGGGLMSRSVVCGVDGSDGSLGAAEVAARISTTLGSSLVLGYAVDASAFPHGNELEAEHHWRRGRGRRFE